jgi:hypothetical protein
MCMYIYFLLRKQYYKKTQHITTNYLYKRGDREKKERGSSKDRTVYASSSLILVFINSGGKVVTHVTKVFLNCVFDQERN